MIMECKVTARKSHYPNQTGANMPIGWVKCKLSDVCQFESGFAFKSESYKKEGVPLIRISNIQDGTITTDGGVCIQEVVESRFHVVKGDLLIALSGATTGKMGIYDKENDAILNQRVGNLRVISKTYFLPEYRNLFMESQTATILEQSWGGAQPNISPNTIIGFDILLPPYAEQCRIVSKANELLALVSNIEFAQDQIETRADVIKTKVLDLAIHGKLVPQDPSEEPAIELLKRINPDFQPSDNLHYGERLPNGWTCGLFGDLNQHRNKSEDPLASPNEEYELYSVPFYETGMPEFLHGKEIGSTKQIVDKGDVLLCKINPHLNRSWVVSHYRPELKCIASSEWLIFANEAVLPDFARLFFISPQFKELMLSNVSGVGGSLMRARASAVNNYPIWIPPINEQKRIVKAVYQLYDAVDSLASNLD